MAELFSLMRGRIRRYFLQREVACKDIRRGSGSYDGDFAASEKNAPPNWRRVFIDRTWNQPAGSISASRP